MVCLKFKYLYATMSQSSKSSFCVQNVRGGGGGVKEEKKTRHYFEDGMFSDYSIHLKKISFVMQNIITPESKNLSLVVIITPDNNNIPLFIYQRLNISSCKTSENITCMKCGIVSENMSKLRKLIIDDFHMFENGSLEIHKENNLLDTDEYMICNDTVYVLLANRTLNASFSNSTISLNLSSYSLPVIFSGISLFFLFFRIILQILPSSEKDGLDRFQGYMIISLFLSKLLYFVNIFYDGDLLVHKSFGIVSYYFVLASHFWLNISIHDFLSKLGHFVNQQLPCCPKVSSFPFNQMYGLVFPLFICIISFCLELVESYSDFTMQLTDQSMTSLIITEFGRSTLLHWTLNRLHLIVMLIPICILMIINLSYICLLHTRIRNDNYASTFPIARFKAMVVVYLILTVCFMPITVLISLLIFMNNVVLLDTFVIIFSTEGIYVSVVCIFERLFISRLQTDGLLCCTPKNTENSTDIVQSQPSIHAKSNENDIALSNSKPDGEPDMEHSNSHKLSLSTDQV